MCFSFNQTEVREMEIRGYKKYKYISESDHLQEFLSIINNEAGVVENECEERS